MLTKNELIVLYGMRTLDYEKDPNPEHWRTISGAKVHLDQNGEIDGGAGGKFTGNYWDGKKGQQHVIGPHTMIKKQNESGATGVGLAGMGMLGKIGLGNIGGGKTTPPKPPIPPKPPEPPKPPQPPKPAGAGKKDYNSNLAKGMGKDHYDGVRNKVDSCGSEEFKSFWGKAESKIDVGSASYKGRGHCSGGRIYVDAESDSKGGMFKAPYSTTFHESGHSIDHAYSAKGYGFFSVDYKNGIFPQTIIDEINEHVEKIAVDIKKVFKEHGSDLEWLYQNGYISLRRKQEEEWLLRNGSTKVLPLKFSKSMAYSKFQSEIDKLDYLAKGDIYDMMEGATKGKIGGGHGKSYWKKFDWFGKNAGLATEAFAEMTSATACNPQSLETIKKYLPRSYKIYQDMMKEIASR